MQINKSHISTNKKIDTVRGYSPLTPYPVSPNFQILKNKKPLKQSVLRVSKSWLWDSNPRPADYKSAALPTELSQHFQSINFNFINTTNGSATKPAFLCAKTNIICFRLQQIVTENLFFFDAFSKIFCVRIYFKLYHLLTKFFYKFKF